MSKEKGVFIELSLFDFLQICKNKKSNKFTEEELTVIFLSFENKSKLLGKLFLFNQDELLKSYKVVLESEFDKIPEDRKDKIFVSLVSGGKAIVRDYKKDRKYFS